MNFFGVILLLFTCVCTASVATARSTAKARPVLLRERPAAERFQERIWFRCLATAGGPTGPKLLGQAQLSESRAAADALSGCREESENPDQCRVLACQGPMYHPESAAL